MTTLQQHGTNRIFAGLLALEIVCLVAACGGRTTERTDSRPRARFDASVVDTGTPLDGAFYDNTFDTIDSGTDPDRANGDAGIGTDPSDATSPDGDSGAPEASADEECPAPRSIDMNCSASCGVRDSSCGELTCGSTAQYRVRNHTLFPFVIRTPSSPGIDDACLRSCSRIRPLTYGLSITFDVILAQGFRARVSPPWYLSDATEWVNPFCAPSTQKASCLAKSSGVLRLLIATDDANAPASNVVVENTSDACP